MTSHPLHQKPSEKKELQVQVEGPAKENADLLEVDPGKCEELNECLGIAEEPSRS